MDEGAKSLLALLFKKEILHLHSSQVYISWWYDQLHVHSSYINIILMG